MPVKYDRMWARIGRYRLWILTGILLAAAASRIISLDNGTPPGLEHDEVAHWLINLDILSGNHAIYFTEAYGHEALYHYLQAYFGALVGDHALGLRLPSVYSGLLLIAISYALGRRMFSWPVGMLAAAFLAVLLWPVFYSRLALRAILLPVLSGLSAYFWWRASDTPASNGLPRTGWPWFALAGLFAGLSIHTYMAARAVPIFFALYTLYLIIFHWRDFQAQWRGLGMFWVVFVLVALPLVWFLWTNPGAEVRIGEVDAPLRAMLQGDLQPVLTNAVKIAGMFGWQGDPLWRQNIAYQTVFDPVTAVLFYLGVALALWRWRDKYHAFLILWLVTAVIPSLVTIDAPSSIRMINLLPVLGLFPAIVIHKMVSLSTIWEKFSTEMATGLLVGVAIVLVSFNGWVMVHGLWRIWPANEEVQFVWQAALTEVAAYLDVSPDSRPVAVGGWTPDTMDSPTMALTMRRDDLSLRFFNPAESLVIPAGESRQTGRIVHPTILPLSPMLAAVAGPGQVLPVGAAPGEQFTLYDMAKLSDPSAYLGDPVDFDTQLRLLGYAADGGCSATEPCTIVTYWQVLAAAGGPRRIFLHRIDSAENVAAQDDRLGAPAEFWQSGDVVVQLLMLPPGEGEMRLGVYNPVDGRRLVVGQTDYVVVDLSPDSKTTE